MAPPPDPTRPPDRFESWTERRPARLSYPALGLFALVFASCLAGSWWGWRKANGWDGTKPLPIPPIASIGGFPRAIEPVAQLATARSLSVRPLFQGFTVKRLKPDGTVDLEAGGKVLYRFRSPPWHGPRPAGRPLDRLPRAPYCGAQTIGLGREGWKRDEDRPGESCRSGGVRELPRPTCSLRELREKAVTEGASASAEGEVEYFWDGDVPAYTFREGRNKKTVTFSAECQVQHP